MNNKIIAAGVVVALCAVALIGVGYAYTAEFQNAGNKVVATTEYVVVQGSTGETKGTITESIEVDFNTIMLH